MQCVWFVPGHKSRPSPVPPNSATPRSPTLTDERGAPSHNEARPRIFRAERGRTAATRWRPFAGIRRGASHSCIAVHVCLLLLLLLEASFFPPHIWQSSRSLSLSLSLSLICAAATIQGQRGAPGVRREAEGPSLRVSRLYLPLPSPVPVRARAWATRRCHAVAHAKKIAKLSAEIL